MPTQRIPLSWPYNPRTPGTNKDQHRINVMDEVLGDRVYTLKRPGFFVSTTYDSGTGQAMTSFNDGLYAVIGDKLKVSSASASGADGSAWTASSVATWAPRDLMGLVNLNGDIFLIGGFDQALNLRYSDVWQLKPGGNWLQCTASAPWSVRSSFMSGVIGNTMFVIGGLTTGGTALNDVWSSQDGVTWTQVTSGAAFSARYAANIINADNGMYLLGGDTGAGLKNDIWFTVDGLTWKEVSPAAIKSDGTAAWSIRSNAQTYYFQQTTTGVTKNALWIAGGINSGAGTNDVWYSLDAGKTWTRSTATAWDTGKYNGGYTVYDNKMWMINGYTGAASSNRVYYSADGITWTLATTSGPWAASYGGAVYVAPPPVGVSTFNYTTMWWVGGNDNSAAPSAVQYYATLNVTIVTGNTGTTLSSTTANQPMQFAPFNNNDQLLLKNQRDLWVIQSGHVTKVKDDRYPAYTVPGLVTLGGYAYVMDPTGLIRNCALSDPFSWPLLNVVGADYESDPGVALAKYLNYVVAFGTYTLQFFYDAGIINGSPLRPYLNANMRVGCASAASVVNIGPTIAWVSRTMEFNRQVMIFNGLAPQVISTPAIDKLLNGSDYDDLSAFAAYTYGHMWYVLYGSFGNSLAYDFSTKQWYEWSNAAGDGPFAFAAACSNGYQAGYFLLDQTNGDIYRFDGTYNNDNGTPFTVTLLTGLIDFGNNTNKFMGPLTVIGDRHGSTPSISWTDDDYTSFSTARTVDMNTQRPILYRNGKTRRRAYKYVQTDSVTMRLEALEQQFEQGQ